MMFIFNVLCKYQYVKFNKCKNNTKKSDKHPVLSRIFIRALYLQHTNPILKSGQCCYFLFYKM